MAADGTAGGAAKAMYSVSTVGSGRQWERVIPSNMPNSKCQRARGLGLDLFGWRPRIAQDGRGGLTSDISHLLTRVHDYGCTFGV